MVRDYSACQKINFGSNSKTSKRKIQQPMIKRIQTTKSVASLTDHIIQNPFCNADDLLAAFNSYINTKETTLSKIHSKQFLLGPDHETHTHPQRRRRPAEHKSFIQLPIDAGEKLKRRRRSAFEETRPPEIVVPKSAWLCRRSATASGMPNQGCPARKLDTAGRRRTSSDASRVRSPDTRLRPSASQTLRHALRRGAPTNQNHTCLMTRTLLSSSGDRYSKLTYLSVFLPLHLCSLLEHKPPSANIATYPPMGCNRDAYIFFQFKS